MRLAMLAAMGGLFTFSAHGGPAAAQDRQAIRCVAQTGVVRDWTIDFVEERVVYRDAGESRPIEVDAEPEYFPDSIGDYDDFFSVFWEGRHTGRPSRLFFFVLDPEPGAGIFLEPLEAGRVVGFRWEEYSDIDPSARAVQWGRCSPR